MTAVVLLAVLNLTSMESDNPFYEDLGPEDGPFDQYEEIAPEDRSVYQLHEANYKFTHPEKITYFGHNAAFIGFDINDEERVIAMVIYLADHEAVLKDLEDEFGEADLNFQLQGAAEFQDGEKGAMNYSSLIWVRSKYQLAFSLYPVALAENSPPTVMGRIAIKER